jgi:hypothetical protein
VEPSRQDDESPNRGEDRRAENAACPALREHSADERSDDERRKPELQA